LQERRKPRAFGSLPCEGSEGVALGSARSVDTLSPPPPVSAGGGRPKAPGLRRSYRTCTKPPAGATQDTRIHHRRQDPRPRRRPPFPPADPGQKPAASAGPTEPARSRPMPPRKPPASISAATTLVHARALAPLAILAWQFWDGYSSNSDALGADPVAEIEHRLSLWALRMLMLALAITPLRQLTGQAVLVRFRRMIGLYAFAYASLHLTAYLVLDLRGYWAQIFEEIAKRPYITVGFAAWLLLVPLAVTSTRGWIRRLGRNWVRLHKLVYAIG